MSFGEPGGLSLSIVCIRRLGGVQIFASKRQCSLTVIPACLHSRKRVAGTQRLRVAASLSGSPAVTRGSRKQPDRSADPLLACGVLNSVAPCQKYIDLCIHGAGYVEVECQRASLCHSTNCRIDR